MAEYYVTEERAFAPGIAGDWPDVIAKPDNPHGRLVKVEGMEQQLEALTALNADLLAACKDTSAILHAADKAAIKRAPPRLLSLPVDRADQLIVIRELDAAIARAGGELTKPPGNP